MLLPQATSRLTSVLVFAVLAQRCTAEQMGVFAIATAIASAPSALAPAVVGKPLATAAAEARAGRTQPAQSAAVVLAVLVAAVLAVAAAATDGLTRQALAAGAIGLPSAMVVETSYWCDVFTRGARAAGARLAGAYAGQAVVVMAGSFWLPVPWLLLSPFVALAVMALAALATRSRLSLRGAWAWCTTHRPTWLPYLMGVAGSVALVQSIPAVLTGVVGFGAASVYRAGELAFGGTNLLIGVISQTLLTQGVGDRRGVHLRAGAAAGAVALANGVVLLLLPHAVLRLVLGETADLLTQVLPAMTMQRTALAVSSVAGTILVLLLTAMRISLLQLGAAVVALSALAVGGAVGGLDGSLLGIAAAEVVLAVVFTLVLRRRT
ncbi:hypothetical protein GTR02_04640 [Kineococcus sp. R8]|uniref:hypothetical protein n=1 Tax=Kineococcus siccus TaxID=2696567 RepID=UPI001412777E|nr:hypothetical protein [Kineococcus siccus]NAZ81101.1 hypothetical protein [Kineococcus siccus]